jgi:formate-dependent phosphoribosylglycinamide formyltransferase (GAR transformylase)
MKRKTWPKKVTEALGGAGLLEWFSWLMMGFTFQNSPRTIPVWLHCRTQTLMNLNCLRAILSLPILKLPWRKAGDSAVILASENIKPTYTGLIEVLQN